MKPSRGLNTIPRFPLELVRVALHASMGQTQVKNGCRPALGQHDSEDELSGRYE